MDDAPLEEQEEREGHGYDFSGVLPDRVYTLKEAAAAVGMTYQEAWRAHKMGSLHTVRSTWNGKRVYVRGSELMRVLREEFVATGKE